MVDIFNPARITRWLLRVGCKINKYQILKRDTSYFHFDLVTTALTRRQQIVQQNITKIKINTQNKDQHKILRQIINKIKMNTSQVPFPLCIYKQHTSNNRHHQNQNQHIVSGPPLVPLCMYKQVYPRCFHPTLWFSTGG